MAVIITDPYRIFLNKCFPENRKCFLHNLSRVIFVLTQTKKNNRCIDDNYFTTIYSNKNYDMIQLIAIFITYSTTFISIQNWYQIHISSSIHGNDKPIDAKLWRIFLQWVLYNRINWWSDLRMPFLLVSYF